MERSLGSNMAEVSIISHLKSYLVKNPSSDPPPSLQYKPAESTVQNDDFEKPEYQPSKATLGAELDRLRTLLKMIDKRKATLTHELNNLESLLQEEEAEIRTMERKIKTEKETDHLIETFDLLIPRRDIVEKTKKLQRTAEKFSSEELQPCESELQLLNEYMEEMSTKLMLSNTDLWSELATKKKELSQVADVWAKEDYIKLAKHNNVKLEGCIQTLNARHDEKTKRWEAQLRCINRSVAQNEKLAAEAEKVCASLAFPKEDQEK